MRVVGVRRWKKIWCVLEGKLLLYFKTQLEYSHQLSPCRGSINMGLVLSITPRGPCQLQIVTRSQIIIFRTKSKSEYDGWFAALQDAKNNNPCSNYTKFYAKDRHSTAVLEMHYRLSNRISLESNVNRISVINENHLRYGRTLKESFEGVFVEVQGCRKNGLRVGHRTGCRKSSSSALRKSESDNRISFYRELHGLVRTETVTAAAGDKEPSCRSRSLSYESIYFKPQENGCAPQEPAKSQSCRELMLPQLVRRLSRKTSESTVSKRMSRSVSFFQRRCEDSDSDDYDYIEVDGIKQKYSKPMSNIDESSLCPELPPRVRNDEIESMSSTAAQSDDFPNQEANVDVIYVNNDHKMQIYTCESDSDLVPPEDGTEQTVGVEDKPPPLPIKKKSLQENVFEDKIQYQSITDGVYVFENGTKEVIYDVPIPHGKLIEHFRRLSVEAPAPKRTTDHVIYDDSLEQSIYETLHNITPDSLETTTFPTYKRWSNDSGFHYEEHNSFSPDQTHFEDSLEPVIAMIHHDRKIWQNVPNINSTDYFR